MSNYVRLVIGLLCFGSAVALATTIKSLTLVQKTARSDRIVVGTVERIRYEKHPTLERIYTITTVRVHESLRGTATKNMRIMIRQIGGTLGQWTQHVVGNARFEVGEEVLVFLRHNPNLDLHFLVGMTQGKLRVDLDGDRINPPEGEVILYPVHHSSTPDDTSPTRKASRSLSAFVQLVRDLSATAPPRE